MQSTPSLRSTPIHFAASIHLRRLAGLALTGACLPLLMVAQTTGTAGASPPLASTEIVELSPFVVDATGDSGYQAENTMSGGRFRVNLRDTAASVSVFTAQFMEDVGIQDMQDLAAYSIGTAIDTGDSEAGANIIAFRSAESTVPVMRIREIRATTGRNYFQSITPDDSYRNGRYDESRGPNGILFGISNAGGMVSSSTLPASTSRDSYRVKYTYGSWNENRVEATANKVLIKDKLGLAVAGLYQDSDAWRDWVVDRRKRVYGAITYKPTDRITLRAMGESATQFTRAIAPFTFADNFLAWEDYGRNTIVPNGANPPSNLAQLGVGSTESNNFSGGGRGRTPRHIFIVNDGSLHNLGGTYNSASYNSTNVLGGISQLDGRFGGVGTLRLNIPERFPYDLNWEGPEGSGRESKFHWWQVEGDVKLTENLYLNIAHNEEYISMNNPYLAGTDPQVYGDPNLTLGVIPANPNNPFSLGTSNPALVAANPNPFAGRLYAQARQFFDLRVAESEETRVGLAYNLKTGSSWLGSHQMAAAVSTRKQMDLIENHRLAFVGAPYHNDPINNANLIFSRYYFDEGNSNDYRYRQPLLRYDRNATTTLVVNDIANPSFYRDGINNSGVEREIGWVRGSVRDNQRVDQEIDAFLFVTQSKFLRDRLAVTLGYREDRASSFDYGYYDLGPFGYTVNQSERIREDKFVGRSKTAGLVYHINNSVSLVANQSRSVGLPNFIRRVLPEDFRENALAVIPPPPDTSGEDYGIDFSVFSGKVSGRLVYFKTSSENEETGGIAGNIVSAPTREIFSILEDSLLGTRYSAQEWEGLRARLTTNADAILRDTKSDGYEMRLVANPTDSWRLSLNFSYTDRKTLDSYKRAIPWLGYIRDGATKEPLPPLDFVGGNWVIPGTPRVTQEGVLSQFFSLAQEAAQEDGVTVTEFINQGGTSSLANWIMQAPNRQWFRLRDRIQDEEQRWGLRPYKANVYTAYDFKNGSLKGFTLGGGVRWRSMNVIGGGKLSQIDPNFDPQVDNDRLIEYKGVDEFQTDLMLRYRHRLSRGRSVSFQLNVYNVLDDTDIVPQRLATTPNQMVPGGPGNEDRGVAMHRFDVVQPRSYRVSATYEF